jgi:hypothetical protein
MSARSNLQELIKRTLKAEDFVSQAPRSESAWSVYSRCYAALDAQIKLIQHHEGRVRDSFPDLVVAPIMVPPELIRGTDPEWLIV